MRAPSQSRARRRASWILAFALAVCMSPAASATALRTDTARRNRSIAPAVQPSRPNVLLVISDDQAWSTFDRSNMPNVFSQIADQGVLFDRHYVNESLCCPSRSSMFTGLNGTDTGVSDNNDPLTRPTLIQAVHDSGYRTLLAGKYLNSWPCANTRPEFDEWYCYGHEGAAQTDPTIDVNGTDVPFVGYAADIFANLVSRFITTTPDDQPFLAVYSPKVPHLPADDLRNQSLAIPPYRPPSFDEDTPNANKPAVVQRDPLTTREIATIDGNHDGMYRTSKSLDDDIGTILSSLGSRAANTVVIYVSDNGFMYGEHRIAEGKSVSYEPSVRTPLAIRDPQLRATDNPLASHAVVQNTDIAATIAERTGTEWHSEGHSLTPIIAGDASTIRDAALIQRCVADSGRACAPDTKSRYFVGEVTDRYKYVEYFTHEVELYDLDVDPWELTNLAGTPGAAAIEQQLAAQLANLRAPPAPDTTIATGPTGTVGAVPTTFTYFTQSLTATYTCRLTGPDQPGDWEPCGDQSQTIGSLPDGTYTFSVFGSDETGATDSSPASRTFTVDNSLPTVAAVSTAAREGNTVTTHRQVTFTISLSGPSAHPVAVSFETDNRSALESSDYQSSVGRLEFSPGQFSKSIAVPVRADRTFESNETFALRLYSVSGANLAADESIGTIVNDDAPPVVAVRPASRLEGTGIGGTLVFPVTVKPASGVPVLVDFQTANGTAKNGVDYTAKHNTLEIPPGQTSAAIAVALNGDSLSEVNETLTMTLSGAVNASLGTAIATGTITDDDPLPVASIADTQVIEGDPSQPATALFTVSLTAPSGQKVKVSYATGDGSATAPADYVGRTGILAFVPGVTQKTIAVEVVGDNVGEGNETFGMTLSNPKHATLGTATAMAEIVDNEGVPEISVSDPTVIEDDAGAAHADFHVDLDFPSNRTVTVDYATVDGSATSPDDYSAAAGTATFDPGAIAVVVSIPITGDTVVEPDEEFELELSGATHATIAGSIGVATIVDDDARPTVSVAAGPAVIEGDDGTTAARFDISLSAASTKTVSVGYQTVDGTAVAFADYLEASGTVTLPPGTTTASVEVPVLGDSVYEADESFDLQIAEPVNAELGTAAATGDIIDDDPVPRVGVDNDVVVTEGDAGTVAADFTVHLSVVSALDTKVKYETVDDTASAPDDYTETTGSVTIPAGATTATVSVPVSGDVLYEGNEDFQFNLTGATNALVNEDDFSAFGIIVDDDAPPVANVSDTSQAEGDVNGTAFDVTVSLSTPSGIDATVDYTTSDDTAIAPDDYAVATGTVVIPAGTTSATISLTVEGDTVVEGDEFFSLTISNPTECTIGSAGATITIVDDDIEAARRIRRISP